MTAELELLLSESMRRHNDGLDVPTDILARASARVCRRRDRTRLLTGAAVTVALIAAGLSATSPRPTDHHRIAASPASSGPSTELAAYVTARARAAMDADHAVLYSRMRYGSTADLAERWTDTHTGWTLIRESGRLSCASLVPPVGVGGRKTTVDYQLSVWWTEAVRPESNRGLTGDRDDLSPAAVRAALADKRLSLDGHESVAGRPALRLSGALRKGTADWIQVVWVDATTYLPVRFGFGPALTHLTTVIDLKWLPRTHTNRARVRLTPPLDFRRISAAPRASTGSTC